jgi:hypothetical protein
MLTADLFHVVRKTHQDGGVVKNVQGEQKAILERVEQRLENLEKRMDVLESGPAQQKRQEEKMDLVLSALERIETHLGTRPASSPSTNTARSPTTHPLLCKTGLASAPSTNTAQLPYNPPLCKTGL